MELAQTSQHQVEPLSITHIITGLNVGGAERALFTVLTHGLEGPFRNRVISLMGPGHYGPLLQEFGIPLTCIRMSPGKPTPGALRRLLAAVAEDPTDIMQGWMLHGNLAATLARWRVSRAAPLVWNQRTSLDALADETKMKRGLIWLESKLSGNPAAIIYNSARARRQFGKYGYKDDNALHIPNGFDTDKWRFDESARQSIRQELGIAQNSTVIGYVGRGHPQKDLGNLYAAFERVAAKYQNVVLVAVGRDLEQGAPDADRIILTGQRNDVPELMCSFDLVCLSSRAEGFPNVIGEAMACGLPCVTTDVGDARDIVGSTGWVAPPRNPELLADCLEAALSCTGESLKERGARARERIVSQFSIPSVIDRYASIYRSVARKHS
jgi:glycosyltransferase involved in cell wall biosynthesis